jgi:hypothetical protein
MQTNNRFLQIITRRANERILIDQQLTVTVLEVLADEVTLEIAGPDGDVQQVTLRCAAPAREMPAASELVHADADLACC